MAVLNTGLATPSRGDFTLDQSLRFNDDDTAYLTRQTTSTGSNYVATFSGWVKRATSGVRQGIWSGWESSTERMSCYFLNDSLHMQIFSGGVAHDLETNAIFRDPSAWYHLVFQFNTSNASEPERFKMFVNGVQETSFSVDDTIGLNAEMMMWGSTSQYSFIGASKGSSVGNYLDGYMAEVHVIDGTVYAPSEFGEAGDYGEWKPKKVSGLTYGTNGFYLDFADSAALGDDESGNTNDYTATNLAAADQMVDSPTNNFPTWNPLNVDSDHTLSEGNLKSVEAGAGGMVVGTMAVDSGKWYWEASSTNQWNLHGIITAARIESQADDAHAGKSTSGFGYHGANGQKYTNNSGSSYGDTFGAGDVIGIALDLDAGTIKFYKNNTVQDSGTVAFSSLSGLFYPAMGVGDANTTIVNFGQDSSFAGAETAQGNQDGNSIGDFYYAPPTGYLALCTSNLPATITPKEHFDTPLYTGTGGSKTISGLAFQPDLVIGGCLTADENHHVHDAVRGVENRLNTVNEEYEYADGALKTFTSDGYTFDTAGAMNTNTEDYVNWVWKANGSGSANTEGSFNTTSTSANTDAGFSIVSWTGNDTNGATLGHGLTKAPELIATKRRTAGNIAWYVYNEGVGNTKYIKWNETAAEATSAIWNNTSPTPTLFTLSGGEGINSSSHTYIAYCWHSVDGYSKIGNYVGNGDNDGTFIYTGFRPAFIWIKSNSSSADNPIFTSVVNPYNLVTDMLFMNKYDDLHTSSGNAEIDIVSNGFKHRYAGGWTNLGSREFVYMAFAETPFKYANAR